MHADRTHVKHAHIYHNKPTTDSLPNKYTQLLVYSFPHVSARTHTHAPLDVQQDIYFCLIQKSIFHHLHIFFSFLIFHTKHHHAQTGMHCRQYD